MSLLELRKKLLEQNRFYLFQNKFKKDYLYDAFSQNLYPIEKKLSDFLFSNSVKHNLLEDEKLFEALNFFDKWKGNIQYAELPETHLTINLSNKCNLNCSYCYRDKKQKNEMSLAKAFEIIEYADKYYKINKNEIVFSIDLTAEAFFDKDKIQVLYEKISEYKDHQKMRLWFMSNGTQISDDYIELIKKIPIDPFWISLDGPEEIHNANRKYYDNKGSFSDVMRNIEKLRDSNINIKISCVLTKLYPYPDKLYKYFKSLKVSEIQMCPIRNGCKVSLNKNDIITLKDSYKQLYEQLFIEILDYDFSSVILLKDDFVLQPVVYMLLRIRQAGRCTWGQEAIVSFNGDMYPCLYVIGNDKYKLGNISEKMKASDFLKPITVNEREGCKSCWARFLCGGTCHYNSIISKGSEFDIDDIECDLRMFFITESLEMIIKLMEKQYDFSLLAKNLCS